MEKSQAIFNFVALISLVYLFVSLASMAVFGGLAWLLWSAFRRRPTPGWRLLTGVPMVLAGLAALLSGLVALASGMCGAWVSLAK